MTGSRPRIDGTAVAAIAAGTLFLWAALKGRSVLSTVQAVIHGQAPKTAAAADPITGTSPAATAPAGSGADVAAAAMKYDGTHNYHYGAPPPDGEVDCSSWATDVIGRDCGLPVPGGIWAKATANGTQHGPSTLSYLAWTGAKTVGHHSSAAEPGDLAVWQTHMGIVTGPNQMISAQDPAAGTGTSQIDGAIPGELLFIRRMTAVA